MHGVPTHSFSSYSPIQKKFTSNIACMNNMAFYILYLFILLCTEKKKAELTQLLMGPTDHIALLLSEQPMTRRCSPFRGWLSYEPWGALL